MRERTEPLTLTDADGDALKIVFALNGEAVAKTVHGGRPDPTRVALSLLDQVTLCNRLKANIAAQVAVPDEAHTEDCIGQRLSFHAATGDDMDCTCGATTRAEPKR